MDVLEEEGFGAGFFGGSVQVFSRSQQPKVGDDDEVTDVTVERAELRVGDIEHVSEIADDRDVDQVDAAGRVILVLHGFSKSSE